MIPAAIALLIVVVGAFGHRAARDSLRTSLQRELDSVLRADADALRLWIDLQCRTAEKIAAASGTAEDPGTAAKAGGFEGFALIDPGGRILAASEPGTVGMRLPPVVAAMLADVAGGKSRLLPAFPLPPDEVGADGATALLVATPLGEARPAPRVLALRVSIAGFTRVLSLARAGETGQTYAFDRNGLLLSESPFEDQLRAAGLLRPGRKAPLEVELRDPGGNTLEGFKPEGSIKGRPLTRAAGDAVSGGRGSDLDGYRDYRGVPVVGAWEWFPDLGLGIVHEAAVAETGRSLRLLNATFWTLFGVAALAALLLWISSAGLDRMKRKVHHVRELGQYTLIEKIGEGAMGKVYRASHKMLRRPTAIKLLEAAEPGALERFEREVQLTSTLTHPNTIAIYDYGRTPDGVFYYAMEYVDGVNLAELVALEGPMHPARVVHVLEQVCGSLAEAHAQGFVHRDIKPSNIMLTSRGGEPDVVKVLDFGLVRRIDRSKETMLTTMGVVFGTPGFIPPETLKDPRKYDARGDLYALGVVAYELLSGHPMFALTSEYEMCRLHLEAMPPYPSVRRGAPLPPDLEALIMRTLSKDPAARPQSAAELRKGLEGCSGTGAWTEADARAWWDRRAAEIASKRRGRSGTSSEPGRTLAKSRGTS